MEKAIRIAKWVGVLFKETVIISSKNKRVKGGLAIVIA